MNILYIVGSQSQILNEFTPYDSFDKIVCCDRKKNLSSTYEFIKYDLLDDNCNKSLVKYAECANEISIIYSSYLKDSIGKGSQQDNIMTSMLANCYRPLDLFSKLSQRYPDKKINGIFISSIYARVSPKIKNYKEPSLQNPLFYGVSKSGVEQGLRWLSCQNTMHRFNSIGLGPLPSVDAQLTDPGLIKSLKESMPTDKMIDKKELASTINFLLNIDITSLRGANIPLDGGYTLW